MIEMAQAKRKPVGVNILLTGSCCNFYFTAVAIGRDISIAAKDLQEKVATSKLPDDVLQALSEIRDPDRQGVLKQNMLESQSKVMCITKKSIF